jgi:hypothetical protein
MLISTEERPSASEPHRRVAHFLRHGAEQLHGQRTIPLVGFNQLERLGISFQRDRALTRSVVQRSTPPISRMTNRKGRSCNRQRREEQI